jgi:adenylate kinase
MIPGVRLVILGRQGAGKGTQCVRLGRHYVVPHISTGDMLRAAVKEQTPLGVAAKDLMDRGDLVSDEVIIGVVGERLAKQDAQVRGYILDGFPRTVNQAAALADLVASKPLDVCVNLDVPRNMVLERLASRRLCTDCGTNYRASDAPDHGHWVCRVCGGDVIQRDDDTEEAINRRLDIYDTQTAPLIDFYRDRGELMVIDGTGTLDDVLNRLVSGIDSRRR